MPRLDDRGRQNMHDSEALAIEVIARCQTLASFSEDPGSIRRTFLSPPMRECHREIARWLVPLGATSKAGCGGQSENALSGRGTRCPAIAHRLAPRYRSQRWSLRRHSRSSSCHSTPRRYQRPHPSLRHRSRRFLRRGGRALQYALHRQPRVGGQPGRRTAQPPGCARSFDTPGDCRLWFESSRNSAGCHTRRRFGLCGVPH